MSRVVLALLCLTLSVPVAAQSRTTPSSYAQKLRRLAQAAGHLQEYESLLALGAQTGIGARMSAENRDYYVTRRLLPLVLSGYTRERVARLREHGLDPIAAALRSREERSVIDDVINSDLIAIGTIRRCVYDESQDDFLNVSLVFELQQVLMGPRGLFSRASRRPTVTVRQIGGAPSPEGVEYIGPNTIACEIGQRGLLHLSNAEYRFMAAGGFHPNAYRPVLLTAPGLSSVYVQSGPPAWMGQPIFEQRLRAVRSAITTVQ